MIRVLKNQRRPEVLLHHARLGADQATDDPEQGAFAAAVAADKHPQSRSGDCEAAAFESFGATGPAVADPVETQP